MKRFRCLFASFALASTFTGTAAAQGVDVADLPPLPASDDDPSSTATLLAASSADEDVVVGAAKREQSLGNVASAVTVITADRIRRFGYRTVAEALVGVAGVYIQDNRLTEQVGIRGLQIEGGFNSRLLLLVDGATINENWGAFAGFGFDGLVSVDDISRIEVIRGPVGAVYGTNAFFAIINIVTRGAAEGQRAWGRVGINSVLGAVATAGFAQGSVDKQIRGSVSYTQRIGEDPTVPEINEGNGLSSDRGQSIIASLVGTYGGSFGQVRAYRARRDSPFAPYSSDPNLDTAYSLYNYQLLVEGGHTRELTKKLVGSVRAYGNLYRYEDIINYAPGDSFKDFGDVATIGLEARGRYEIVEKKLGATLGAEANYNRTESRAFTVQDDSDRVDVPVNYSTQGIYGEVDGQPLPWLGFTAGVRFDNNTKIDARVSPRAALFLAKPEQYGLKLLYAQGFRNPSMFEGFFADGVDFIANPDISSETIRSYEAVVWGRPVAGLSLRGSAFFWDTDNVIEQRPSVANMAVLQFQNTGKYRSYGAEIEGTYRTSSGWFAFGGGGLQRVGFGDKTGGVQGDIEYGKVTNAPTMTATGGASTPRLGGLVHVSLEGQFVGERPTRFARSPIAGVAQTADAWLGLNGALYFPSVAGFDITAGVRNILGKRDLQPSPGDYDRPGEGTPVDQDGDGIPDPTDRYVPLLPSTGRELYLKVGYTF